MKRCTLIWTKFAMWICWVVGNGKHMCTYYMQQTFTNLFDIFSWVREFIDQREGHNALFIQPTSLPRCRATFWVHGNLSILEKHWSVEFLLEKWQKCRILARKKTCSCRSLAYFLHCCHILPQLQCFGSLRVGSLTYFCPSLYPHISPYFVHCYNPVAVSQDSVWSLKHTELKSCSLIVYAYVITNSMKILHMFILSTVEL